MSDRIIRVSAAVIVDDQSRILLVRKRGTSAFMQPGGKIDPGETPLAALRRELREELAVDVPVTRISALGHYVADAANEPGHMIEADLFSVTLDTAPEPASEIEEMVWIDVDAPGDVELAPLTREPVLRLVRESRCKT